MKRFKTIFLAGLICCLASLTSMQSSAQQCFTNFTISPIGNYCGTSTAITLSGSQSGVSYQLNLGGTAFGSPVIGGGGQVTLPTVTAANIGTGITITVVASQAGSGCNPYTVAGGYLTMTPPPGGTVSASSSKVCPTGPVTFTATTTYPGVYNFAWSLGSTNVGSGPTFTTTTPGTYSLVISNSCGSTAPITCPTITSSPTVGNPGAITGTSTRIAGTGTSNYSIAAVANAAAYSWSVSPLIAGTWSGTIGSSNTITWNPDFYGTAIIRVTASGNCGTPSNPSLLPVSVDQPSATDYSYIQETDVRVPGIIASSGLTIPIGQKNVTFSYTDQAGRSIQQVMQAGSPGGNDAVQPLAYDPAGRKVTGYLPYTVSGSTTGSYKSTPIANQAVYYNPLTPGAQNIATSINSTSQTQFDNSPLERATEQGYPGMTWIQGGGHTVTTNWGTNAASEISYWIVSANGASTTSYFAPGTLTTTSVTDENGNAVIQYVDYSGKMVCKKIANGASTYLYTYYIYDDAHNLRYVIPPIPTQPVPVTLPNAFAETDAIFANFFYGYHYDGRNRLTEKKIPGKGWEYYVYNRVDEVILSQTPTQGVLNIWSYSKYDSKGRVIMTGDYTTTSTRATLQTTADNFTSTLLFESFNNSTTNYGYTDTSYPSSTVGSAKKVLSVSYYDTYSFITNTQINPNTAVFVRPTADTIFKNPIGQLTGSLTTVLGAASPTYLLAINHYDTHGRTVETIGQFFKQVAASAGNYDIITNQYSFSNLLIKSTHSHYLSSTLALTIVTYYGYDNQGRKTLLKQQYNGGSIIDLAKYDYNELGQLTVKNLQSINTANIPPSSSFLQHLNYKYNIRGWMNFINNPTSPTMADPNPNFSGQTDLFAEEIDYDSPNSLYTSTTPQYNGNISTISWQTLKYPGSSMVQEEKGYVFSYDGLNRLTAAFSKAPSGNDKYNEQLSYDELGNILSLNRSSSATTFLNELSYDYGSGSLRSNILLDVHDNGGTENYGSTYGYIPNSGNLTTDSKNGISQIVYNEINLPSAITFSSGKTITFYYSSAGEEVERVIQQSGIVAEDRSYVHGIEYSGSAIDFIHTDEGRSRYTGSAYKTEYQIADHLGNIRAVFGDEDGSNSFTAGQDIVQATDYYPFGRQISYLEGNPSFQYKYNGKEFSTDLNAYNFGARYYNPTIARWNCIDNNAEENRRMSPDIYANNNPIRFIDPDGNQVDPNTNYANAVSLMLGTQISQGYENGMDDQMAAAMEADYEEGKSNDRPLQYDPVQIAINNKISNDVMHQTTDWMKSYGTGDGLGFYGAVNGGSSSEGFNSSGFSNALAHLTPFGGIIDFANAAKNDNVGGAVLGLASSAAFFTGDALLSGGGSTESESTVTLFRNMGSNEASSLQTSGNFSIMPDGFQGKQFWIGDSGLNFWKSTDFVKPYDVKVTIGSSFVTPGHANYIFMEPGDSYFNGLPSVDNHPGGTVLPGNLQRFNNNINWEFLPPYPPSPY